MLGTSVGSYTIQRELGRGGMGAVYVGTHALLGRPAAIKVLLPQFSQQQEIVQRFFNEARAATAVKHPGIVEIYDFGYATDGSAYIVMELCEGETLAQRLKRVHKVAIGYALNVARQIAGALAAAHKAGIVHRDLKPDNVFLVPDSEVAGGERIKLLDFGIAKLMGDGAQSGGLARTSTGALMGTPYYMSPEQCRGAGHVDHRSDLYSLGCILFEMVCGRVPFVGEGAGEIIGAHLLIAPPSPRELAPELPPEVEGLILALLTKKPDERIPSADALIAEIHRITGSLPPGAGAVPGVAMTAAQAVPPYPTGAPGTSRPPTAPPYTGMTPGTPTPAPYLGQPAGTTSPPPTTLGGAAGEPIAARPRRTSLWIAVGLLVVGAGAAAAILATSGGGGGGGGTGTASGVAPGASDAALVASRAIDAAAIAPPPATIDATAIAATTIDATAIAATTIDAGAPPAVVDAAAPPAVVDAAAPPASYDARPRVRPDAAPPRPDAAVPRPRDEKEDEAKQIRAKMTELIAAHKCADAARLADIAQNELGDKLAAPLVLMAGRCVDDKHLPEHGPGPRPVDDGALDEQLLTQAREAIGAGQYAKALHQCQEVLKHQPSSEKVLELCTLAACGAGNRKVAERLVGRLPSGTAARVKAACERNHISLP